MIVQIEVTAEDIQKGFRRSAESCPISRACKRAGMGRVLVGPDNVLMTRRRRGEDIEIDLPAEIIAWMRSFDVDGREAVQPVSFELDLSKGEAL